MDKQNNIDFLDLQCRNHQNRLKYIYLKEESNLRLACTQCLTENKLDNNYLIDIDQLCSEKENEGLVFKSLPKELNDQLYEQLRSNSIQQWNNQGLKDQINQMFDQILSKIIIAMNDHKNKILMEIDNIEAQRMNVIQNYNQVSRKLNIRNKIQEFSQNYQKLEEYLQAFIMKNEMNSGENILQIEISLKDHTKQYNKVDINVIQNNLQNILENIQQINMVKCQKDENQQEEEEEEEEQQQQQQQQQEEEQQQQLQQQQNPNQDIESYQAFFKIVNEAFENGNYPILFQEQIKKDIKQFLVNQNIVIDVQAHPQFNMNFFILIRDEKKKHYGSLKILVTPKQYKIDDFLNIHKAQHILKSIKPDTKLIELIKCWWKFSFNYFDNKTN